MRFLKTVQVRVSQYTHTPILAKKKIRNSREHFFPSILKFILINKYILKNIYELNDYLLINAIFVISNNEKSWGFFVKKI